MTADRAGLGVLGIMFGALTAGVVLMAFIVVFGHIEGRLVLDQNAGYIAESEFRSATLADNKSQKKSQKP